MCAKMMDPERELQPEAFAYAKTVWEAGLTSFDRYIGSGWIPPENVCPDAEIWSATLREIFGVFSGRDALLVWWDALTLEQRYDAFKGRPLGLDAFIDAWNQRVFHLVRGFCAQ